MTKCELDLDTMLEKREMTPYRLAINAGIQHSMMSRMRGGKVKALKLDVIAALCTALDCSPNDILKLVESKKGRR